MLEAPAADPATVPIHSAPGRAATVRPNGREGAAFIFRPARFPAGAVREPGARTDLLSTTYQGMRWRVPELLGRFRTADGFDVEAAGHAGGSCWSATRRICLALGEGSRMAVVGAASLAAQLRYRPGDVGAALRR